MVSSDDQILGYSVYSRSMQEMVEEAFTRIRHPAAEPSVFACINPHSYAVALKDPVFSAALVNSSWLVPDGVGVSIAARILGKALRSRLTGPDFFTALSARLANDGGARVFFLGSTPETLEKIRQRFAVDFPGATVVGTYSPPFKPVFDEADTQAMVDAVNAAKPDVLWVGMTAPKQEKWIAENRLRLRVPFIAAVGAVFDFYAGNVKRAHPVFQRLGLEWLPRLVQQPKRLWRRMFVSAPVFVFCVIRERFVISSAKRSGN